MNNKVLTGIIVAVLALAGVGAVAYTQQGNEQAYNQNSQSADQSHSDSDGANHSGDGEATGETIEANTVVYQDFAVEQPSIKVKKGTTVTWTNKDTAKHDVTPVNETDDFKASKLFGKGESHQVTFNTVGTFEYFCSPHPYMKGVVEVVE